MGADKPKLPRRTCETHNPTKPQFRTSTGRLFLSALIYGLDHHLVSHRGECILSRIAPRH